MSRDSLRLVQVSRVQRLSERVRRAKERALSAYAVEPRFNTVLLDVFIDFRDLEEMSYERRLSEPLSGYVPLAGLLKRSRLRQDRPLSDGDVWALYLSSNASSPYRNITDHSCLKVYHKDPAQAFSHGPRPANGDARVSTPLTHASTGVRIIGSLTRRSDLS